MVPVLCQESRIQKRTKIQEMDLFPSSGKRMGSHKPRSAWQKGGAPFTFGILGMGEQVSLETDLCKPQYGSTFCKTTSLLEFVF